MDDGTMHDGSTGGEKRPDDEPDLRPDGERDFGDSAGYGSGGSTRDRREVGDEGDAPKRPNPLDGVVEPGRGRRPG